MRTGAIGKQNRSCCSLMRFSHVSRARIKLLVQSSRLNISILLTPAHRLLSSTLPSPSFTMFLVTPPGV